MPEVDGYIWLKFQGETLFRNQFLNPTEVFFKVDLRVNSHAFIAESLWKAGVKPNHLLPYLKHLGYVYK